MIAGSVLGVLAKAKDADSRTECRPSDPNTCSPTGAALRHDAFALAHGSTATFVAGGALVAGGVLMLATGRGGGTRVRAALAPAMGTGVAGVVLRGAW
jgi:hypothetical protein